MNYALIGGGNMGRALVAALLQREVCSATALFVVEPDAANRERLRPLGIAVGESADDRVSSAAVVVLCVKPQQAPEAMSALRPLLRSGQTVLSIMAGVSLGKLREGLGHRALVRAMPNTPAQIGLGMTVYCADESVGKDGLARVEALLNACGATVRVDSEDAIDAATAVSGSGPAYVFYLAEHWSEAARRLGFTPEQATLLVQQTLLGATELWKRQGLPAGTLREQVTSKGGTTAAALEVFERRGLGLAIEEGIERAYHRAKELSR
jgi:pyrroline-5-carboxylate reductase